MTKQNFLILLFGIFLIFLAIFLCTRPALYESWDLSSSGQIGDTIGGITSPLINLIGAYLVFISFQAQITANKLQADALENEKTIRKTENDFQKQISQFEDIKLSLREIEFVVELPSSWSAEGGNIPNPPLIFKGLNALNEYINRIRNPDGYQRQSYSTYGIYITFQFMMLSLYDLIENVELKIEDEIDKEYLIRNIKLFYLNFLQYFADNIIERYKDDPKLSEVIRINELFKKRFLV